MTYCVSMRVDEGLVFLCDTRTNAGLDNHGTYRKLFVHQPTPDRTFVIQSAGSLATTQQVMDLVDRDLANSGAEESLASCDRVADAALYLGRLSVEVAASHRPALAASGVDGTSTFLLGGQVGDSPPDILLVHPEGNYIRASDDRPFLQIGETKYGKFLLEVGTRPDLPLVGAAKVALSSMISTARANLSVGPPYDLGIYRAGSHDVGQVRIAADSPYLARLTEMWTRHLDAALDDLPMVEPDDLQLQ